MYKRITTIVGAGAILDFDLPDGVKKPTTQYITDEVVGLELKNVLTGKKITEIKDAYNVLKQGYPTNPNFEMLFHVLEMWYAYGWVWTNSINPPKNPCMYPVFAPFVKPKQKFDITSLSIAISYFLLKVMDIVNTYNAPYLADSNFNSWYRGFWKSYCGCWDVFNLNYDTTIEHSLDVCEDGFEEIPNQDGFMHFSPQKFWVNERGCSTMSHLHGCIEFFDERYDKKVYEQEFLKYDYHDMYKYSSYEKVRNQFENSSKSHKSNQAGEQLIGTPIITGLRKNDKLNTIPFDFYHGHLFNCILKNNSLLIVGYSFGDIYINHVIERMELIHGDNKRIVLIDKWSLYGEEEIEKITDAKIKEDYIRDMMRQKTYDADFGNERGDFLCRITGKSQYDAAVSCFKNYDMTGPMISTNGCLMLFIGGFKSASLHKDEIYAFLNS